MIKYIAIDRSGYSLLESYREDAIVGIIYARSPQHADRIAGELGLGQNILISPAGRAMRYFAAPNSIDWDSKKILHQPQPAQPTPSNPRGAGRKPQGERVKVTMTLTSEDAAFLRRQPNQSQFLAELIARERLTGSAV